MTGYHKINRFIPAYAGNSMCCLANRLSQSVHPRLRGELITSQTNINTRAGSSPLTRGTPSKPKKRGHSNRFIPAYAGNSDSVSPQSNLSAVHPRLRGELVLMRKPALPELGSSPLTRGTLKKLV